MQPSKLLRNHMVTIISLCLWLLVCGKATAASDTLEKCHLDKQKADIVIVVDDSASITDDSFAKIRNFLLQWVSEWTNDVNSAHVRFGVIKFADWAETQLNLAENASSNYLREKVRSMPHSGVGTCIKCGLVEARTMLSNQVRSDAKPVVLVLTDGMDDDPNTARLNVERIKSDFGGTVLSVVVGAANIDYHKGVFGEENMFNIDRFEQLDEQLRANLTKQVCDAVATAAGLSISSTPMCTDKWFIPFLICLILAVLLLLALIALLLAYTRRVRVLKHTESKDDLISATYSNKTLALSAAESQYETPFPLINGFPLSAAHLRQNKNLSTIDEQRESSAHSPADGESANKRLSHSNTAALMTGQPLPSPSQANAKPVPGAHSESNVEGEYATVLPKRSTGSRPLSTGEHSPDRRLSQSHDAFLANQHSPDRRLSQSQDAFIANRPPLPSPSQGHSKPLTAGSPINEEADEMLGASNGSDSSALAELHKRQSLPEQQPNTAVEQEISSKPRPEIPSKPRPAIDPHSNVSRVQSIKLAKPAMRFGGAKNSADIKA